MCSRAYVRAGTDRCTADGLVFYPRFLLPGYCGVVREADGDLNFCCYVIPGGTTAPTDLRAVHEWLVSSDPEVSAVLGPDAKIDRMQGLRPSAWGACRGATARTVSSWATPPGRSIP